MRSRCITLAATHNVRDLGGYRTGHGRTTRWNRLLRGAHTWQLPDEDVRVLLEYGLKAVIDLREEPETSRCPSVFRSRSNVHYENISMRSDELLEQWQKQGAGGGMAGFYIMLIERAKREIHTVLDALRRTATSGCTLFHCSAGKDRTGVIAALVLGALDVPVEIIAEDYALSWQYLQPVREKLQREAAERGGDPQLALRGWSAKPQAMSATIAHIDRQYGGVAAYLRSIGSDGLIETLQSIMLD